MASIPESATIEAIRRAYEADRDPPRAHLGASVIGRSCKRQLWYGFRWAFSEQHDGRLLRLFERGRREEEWLASDLRRAGVNVMTVDPRTGRQFQFSAVGGHVGGSMDGAALGLPEAPKTWHVLEFKTHSAKSFGELTTKGLKAARPEHWAQVQLYMRWAGLDRAAYLAVNKDTDALYLERVHFDAAEAERLEQRAASIVEAARPPAGVSEDPSWYECKFCPAASVCHRGQGVQVNCRTCVHATPELDGDGRWSCAFHGRDITTEEQRKGCAEHRLIPEFMPWAEQIDGDAEGNWISYRTTSGTVFTNGDGAFTSAELALGPDVVTAIESPDVAAIKAEFDGAQVTAVKPAWMQQSVGRVA